MTEGATFGSLFSGIGGIDLGLERAGWSCEWQVELDSFRREVLRRRFPGSEIHNDVTTIDAPMLRPVHLICGGFPCEDISRVGRRAGITGAKSGLWSHMHRIVRYLQPDYVLVENSTSLLVRGLDRVVADLAAIGYDAEWDCLPAAAFGAPHIRDRIYLLAYPRERRHRASDETVFAGWASSQLHGGWAPEPGVDRVADGIPGRVDRLAALGDAVVPAVAEWIGRRIMGAA
jgi:DNA (cytosine-5)-methyltransferase 1